ncbi:MAG: type II secretion system protein [Bacilli bacterium]|nr:type II secretion system protein [Bacilli bacterium]
MKGLNNQSGFTIIELILSFVFVFTIAFSMYQLVFNYKEKRDQESIAQTMTDYKNEVTLAIQRDISDRSLKSIDYCTTGSTLIPKCLELYFNDGTKKQLSVETESIDYDGEEVETNYIKYGSVNYKNDEALLVTFSANYMLYKTYQEDNLGENVIIYKIAIPIYHNDLGDEDFGIYVNAIGYNYDATKVDGDATGGIPVGVQTAEGRQFKAEYHMKCITNNFSRTDLYKQTMIIRFKVGDLNKAKGSHLLGNLNNNGAALTIDNKGRVCYSAFLKSTETEKPVLHKLCSGESYVAANTWYTVVGGFKSNASASNTTSTGYSEYLSVNNNEFNSPSTAGSGFANYRISGSNINYSVGVEPGNVINLAFFDGIVQDVALYNGIAPTDGNPSGLGNGSVPIKTLIETSFGTTGKVFHYDFTDTSVYANFCLD